MYNLITIRMTLSLVRLSSQSSLVKKSAREILYSSIKQVLSTVVELLFVIHARVSQKTCA
jgi:hypothetical protein